MYQNISAKLKLIPGSIKDLWRSSSKLIKVLFVFCLTAILTVILMRLLAFNYQHNQSKQDNQFGTTFVASYAEHLGLDKREAFDAITSDLKLSNVRLVSYWSEGEKDRGEYDFSELDWQFQKAREKGIKVSLSIGLRQPRWPECHQPEWSKSLTKDEWYPELKKYLSLTVNRYRDNPSLSSYQLENEYFLKDFGICPDYSRDRLIDEFNLVKSLDPDTPVILSRSNNYGGFALGEPRADIYGISVYRKVYNPTLGFITYPFPPWYYAFLAQGQLSLTGRPSIIHEFQLEPWLESGEMRDASIEDQDKTMSAKDIEKNIKFAKRTGIKEVYFWGSEWWYWRLKQGDPSIWNAIKQEITK